MLFTLTSMRAKHEEEKRKKNLLATQKARFYDKNIFCRRRCCSFRILLTNTQSVGWCLSVRLIFFGVAQPKNRIAHFLHVLNAV